MLKRNRAAIVLAVAFVIAAMLAPKAQADTGSLAQTLTLKADAVEAQVI